jgi:UDP-4-amino-4-deoxy-L-arabinose-oxoglutarate aminotransferase
MRKTFLPFSQPVIDEGDIAAIGDVLRSGWITTGPKNAEFEQGICKYVGCPKAVALASATAGMHILLKALNIGPGDEVITPSMTWVSTINLITLAGAKPVFADIDRDTLMMTPETAAAVMTPRTKLIIPVHFAGAPFDVDGFEQLIKGKNIKLIHDAAHALGTFYKGKHIGHAGTSLFSFHPIKNMTTGEGGMFCSDDDKLVDQIRRLKFHGLGVDAFDRQQQGRSPQAEVIEPGYKYNMTDISAVLGVRQLAKLDEFNRKRTELAMKYRELFKGIDEIIPLSDPAYPMTHAWNLFIVRLDINKVSFSRDEFMAKLKQKNIGTGLHFRAAHTQKFYRETMNVPKSALPATEWNSERMLSIPLFPAMTNDDINDVVEAIKETIVNG